MEVLGTALVTQGQIQRGPDQTLRKDTNCWTSRAELLPSGTRVVVKEITIREIGPASSRVDFIKVRHFIDSLIIGFLVNS